MIYSVKPLRAGSRTTCEAPDPSLEIRVAELTQQHAQLNVPDPGIRFSFPFGNHKSKKEAVFAGHAQNSKLWFMDSCFKKEAEKIQRRTLEVNRVGGKNSDF